MRLREQKDQHKDRDRVEQQQEQNRPNGHGAIPSVSGQRRWPCPASGVVRLRASSVPAIIPSLLTLREGGTVSPPTHDHGRFEFDDKAKDTGSTAFRTVRNILAIIGLLFIIALILLAVGVYKLAT